MATAQDIVTRAMKELQVLGVGESATADEATDVLAKLNSMLAAWELDGIVLQSGTLALTTTVNVPDRDIEAIVNNLAVRIAPSFEKTPSPVLLALAQSGFNALSAAYAYVPELRLDTATTRLPSQLKFGRIDT